MKVVETPELTDKHIVLDVGHWIKEIYKEIRNFFETFLVAGKWNVVSIEGRCETLYGADPAEQLSSSPAYEHQKTLATFDITAIEDGPLARIEDEKPVAIPRRKMRLKAELESSGALKITECDVEPPKRAGY